MNNQTQVCYVCGKPGPDSKEHVIPRQFLPAGNFNNASRFTLPAHTDCNQAYSKDEEYARDLIAPATELLNLQGAEKMLAAANRSLRRTPGFRRRQDFLNYAQDVQLRDNRSGLHLGRGLGVPFNRERLHRVGKKIAKGVIFLDAAAVIADDDIQCSAIPLAQVMGERETEMQKGNPYWVALGWSICLHDMYAPAIDVRRIYIGQPTTPITIDCVMAVMLLAEYFIVTTRFVLPDNAPPSFPFCIDTSSGEWTRNENAG